MNTTEWNKLDAAANAAGFYQLTMAAEDNAAHTVHVEKAASVEDFADLCLGSLEGLLADSDDEAAKAFFKAQGVRF